MKIQPVQPNEVSNRHLSPMERAALFAAMNMALMGDVDVYVSLTYDKQTKTGARIAGRDYVAMPGVSSKAQMGKLTVHRRADNRANRKAGLVGKPYCKVESLTRANGFSPVGYTNIRPEAVTSFAVTGFQQKEVQND